MALTARSRLWLLIGAVVVALGAVVALVVVVAGDDDGDDGDTAAPSSTTASTAAEDTATTTGGDSGTTAGSECPPPDVPGEVLAEADLDGDGSDELLVRVGAGGPRDVVGLYRLDGCEAVGVTLDGAPAEFAVGASVRATGGLQCGPGSPPTLLAYTGESTDGVTYAVTWRELRLDGGTLTEVNDGSGTASPGDPLYTAASTFACRA